MTFDIAAIVACGFIGLGVGMAYMAGEGRARRHPRVTSALHWAGLILALVAAHWVN